jgi:hypothetical protein
MSGEKELKKIYQIKEITMITTMKMTDWQMNLYTVETNVKGRIETKYLLEGQLQTILVDLVVEEEV